MLIEHQIIILEWFLQDHIMWHWRLE